MPIKFAVDSRIEPPLAVYRYGGHISLEDVLDSVTRAVKGFAPNRPFRELLIFEHHCDLSDFDPKSLETLYRKCAALFGKLKLGPRTAAAMLDESMDAKIIMPLFNALSQAGGGVDLRFELFTEVEPALKWLGVPLDNGLATVNRTA